MKSSRPQVSIGALALRREGDLAKALGFMLAEIHSVTEFVMSHDASSDDSVGEL